MGAIDRPKKPIGRNAARLRRDAITACLSCSLNYLAIRVIGASTTAQAAKMSQQAAKYQDTPKGEQRCENCIQFEAPSACKTVDGTVAAQGWCMVYAKKPA
jgi:hypothetical protein